MMKKFITLFIISMFSVSLFAETELVSGQFSKLDYAQSIKKMNSSAIDNIECNDCESKNCDDNDEHCSHHCSGIHNVTVSNGQSTLILITREISKTYFSQSDFYKIPFLDPALKPPTHS
jgi:hypothetical protein